MPANGKGSRLRAEAKRAEVLARRDRLELDGFDAMIDAAAIQRFERERASGRSRASLVHGFAPPRYEVSPVAT